jgi:pilus assembly protein CpaB
MNAKALLVSLAVAAAGVVLTLIVVSRYRAEVAGGAPVAVVVATADIPPGTVITETMLGVHMLPAAYIESRHVDAAEARSVVGLRASTGIRSGQSVLWTDVDTGAEGAASLATLVTGAGMRAVSLRVSASSSFDGLLRPGDRVDVVHTTERPGSGERVTTSLLQNVLVLAVGGSLGRGASQCTGSSQTAYVSLAASIDQAQILLHAQESGDLNLMLRNPDDVAVIQGIPDTVDADLVEPARRARRALAATSQTTTLTTTTPLPERVTGDHGR